MKKTAASPTSPAKGKLIAEARAWLEIQQEALKTDFLENGDADQLLIRRSDTIDQLLASLYEAAPGEKPVALMAVGGYGRRELYPHSDIDLLFLYESGHEKEAAAVAEFVLYALWDMGLKIGQAHRSIDETISLAQRDITIRTSLLDARQLAGPPQLFAGFEKRFEKEVKEGSDLAFVEAKLAERDARHLRFGDSRYMLEPNVKEGKGGLRDLHTLWWLARYLYPIESFQAFASLKLLNKEEYQAFDQARQFLTRVRVHLHYLTGHAEERLTFDRQHQLAIAMGYDHDSNIRAITRFMRRYFVAVRTIGNLTRIFCALLEEEKKRKPRKSLAWLWQTPSVLAGFKLEGERLSVRNPQTFARQPLLMLELFKVAQENDLDIHPRALHLVARNLKRLNYKLQQDARANTIFLDILLSPKGPESSLRRMSEAGVLGQFIPDFGRVIGQTQFNMYHVYTVDEHTLVALGMLHAIEKGRMKEDLPLASDIIHRIKMRRVLYLALFCHDIAKGRGGDHSALGERIATKLATRFGFSADEIETTAWLVKNHLLFSDTAFKRDINDPKTIADFVAAVRSPERLRLLLLLTVADIRAVSPAVWNAWKGALFRDLFARAEQAMGEGQVTLKPYQAGALKEGLKKLLPEWREAEVDQYLEQGNPGFLTSCSATQHAIIARMLKQANEITSPLMIDTQHHYPRSITEITLVTVDQHGLFSKLTGALALAGANIINARIFTLKSGMAVDLFQVQDAVGEVFDRADKLARMSVYIEQALAGELDLAREFAKRKKQRQSASRAAVEVPGQVFVDNDASNIHTVIEISGQDRSGFLYQVTHAISELRLSISTAHISTFGTQVADVFYVKDGFGMKITHEAKVRQIREALLTAVNS